MEFFLMRKAIEQLPDNDVPNDGGAEITVRGEVPMVAYRRHRPHHSGKQNKFLTHS
jgi:hypothetical protein